MAKRSESQSITIERNNTTYRGQYYVEGKMVHVSSFLGAKTTQIGGSTAEFVARMLLREIVDQAEGWIGTIGPLPLRERAQNLALSGARAELSA